MKDVQMMLEAYRAGTAMNAPFALATVVKVEGSAYRRPGARMLVYPDGRRVGSLSGGCLEEDVAAHAIQAISTGKAVTVEYDPQRANGDVILETGCKGVIAILIEPSTTADLPTSLDFLVRLVETRHAGTMATVFTVEGTTDCRIGDRLMLTEDSDACGTVTGTPLAEQVANEVALMGTKEKTRTVAFRSSEGIVHVLLESLVPPIALLLCGSGHDTAPLARLGAAMGWQVTVADPDASSLTPDRYPDAHALLPVRPECLATRMALDHRTAAVLMTHRYAADLAWFRALLPTPLGYIGVLGPRVRWQQIQRDLAADGNLVPESDRALVHSPAGLDIGSETPEEIALSIVAEIMAMMNSRSAGFLRHREIRVHPTTEGDSPALPLFSVPGNACPL